MENMENKDVTVHLENSLENLQQEKEVEEFLKEQIFSDLEKGRPGFDKPHTQTVVIQLKDIFKNVPGLPVDRAVLIIVAYTHDWGYSELFEGGKPVQLEEMADAKIAHMDFGAQKLEELLEDDFFNYLTAFNFRIAHSIIFDQLLAPIAFYHTKKEVKKWLEENNLQQKTITRRNHNSWRGFGIKL